MTGEKNKFTTTEKLWKLNDETLSTPEHDEMVIWALNHQEDILKIIYSDFKVGPGINRDIAFAQMIQAKVCEARAEFPIVNGNFIVGYADIAYASHFNPTSKYTPLRLIIEIKPKIKSFGETLRQLNTYRSYISQECKIGLLTKDIKFKSTFESQGINVIEYAP